MAKMSRVLLLLTQIYLVTASYIKPSCTTLSPSGSIKPTIASGYEYAVLATGLSVPRSLRFDSHGNLLVMEAYEGLSSFRVTEKNGCLQLTDKKRLINDTELIHGLELSSDEHTVYVQTLYELYSRSYDGKTRTVGTKSTKIVGTMNGEGHVTRTMLIPKNLPNTLLVSRGSLDNIDPQASNKSSGVSTVKSFNLKTVPKGGYDHASGGHLIAWGLRNSVGVVEHPLDTGLWTVENSVDELLRDGVDVHNNNPGEEMNFLGYLNGRPSREEGTNFGYPDCFTAWNTTDLPANKNLRTGSPFAPSSSNDTYCAHTTPPRLTFQAHTAPLDMKFTKSAEEAYITFHGSWNREAPVGYYIGKVKFNTKTGQPVASRDSKNSVEPIFGNLDNSVCPGNCIRPVSIAFDHKGRMFVSSDDSGEIYLIKKVSH